MAGKRSLIFGVGVNDVDYITCRTVEFKNIKGEYKRKRSWVCPYYLRWMNMLQRCYSKVWQLRNPSYIGCTCDSEWLYLSNFIKWVDEQPNRNWESCELDKDFLMKDNKHYGKNTCVFINKSLNSFTSNRRNTRGSSMVGTYFLESTQKYQSHCNDPFKRDNGYLGSYHTELEAHKVWQAKKHQYACELADLQPDIKVANALRYMYAENVDFTNKFEEIL